MIGWLLHAVVVGVLCGWSDVTVAQTGSAEEVSVETGSGEDAAPHAHDHPELDIQLCEEGDSDGDGLCDRLERETGTRPLRADTDGDGVPDGLEDLNQDGIVDPGETDPRVPGLFAGGYPHIPEPMVFDLVRGLGADAGEAEVNTLLVATRRRGHTEVLWAPEVEWAFADNLAIEFELPMDGRELHALKAAFQATLPPHDKSLTHGLQVIGEYLLSEREVEMTALYLAGGRFGHWSFLAMLGGRTTTPSSQAQHYTALVNPSVYVDLDETATVGVESIVEIHGHGRAEMSFVPQIHWQLSRRVRVQVGGGVHVAGGSTSPLFATRLILE